MDDVTAVTAILIKLPTAVEITGSGRSACRNDFGLRFLVAMVILGRVRLHNSLTQTLPCRVDPDLSAASRACATKRLSGIVNQTLPNGDGFQIYAIAFRPGGRGRFYLPSQRHGTHSETCRSLVWMSAFRAMVLQKSFRGADRKFLEPLVRFMRGDVRDHIGSSKIDHGPP